jgi:prolyl oligopeptidase PreP (S9A serine peptidase family)
MSDASTDAAAAADAAPKVAPAEAVGEHDWLEEVALESNLDWVRAQNADTLGRLGDPEQTPLYSRVLAILDSKDKIPCVRAGE